MIGILKIETADTVGIQIPNILKMETPENRTICGLTYFQIPDTCGIQIPNL